MWKLFRTGFALAMFVHDEIVATCPNDGRAHIRADVMSQIMRDEMAKVLGAAFRLVLMRLCRLLSRSGTSSSQAR